MIETLRKGVMMVSMIGILVVLLPMDSMAASGDDSAFAVSLEKVTVGFSILEPWKMSNNGVPDGAEYEILKVISRKLRRPFEIEIAPFKRCLLDMRYGYFDIMTGLLKKKEREKYIYYIEPPYKTKSNKAFYVLKGREKLISRYEDLYKLKIGTETGNRYFPRFDKDDKISKEQVRDADINVKKLLAGHIDAFIMTDSQGDYLIQTLNVQRRIAKAEFVYSKINPVYIGISKKGKLASRQRMVSNLISEMIKSGEIEKIMNNYFIINDLPIPEYN